MKDFFCVCDYETEIIDELTLYPSDIDKIISDEVVTFICPNCGLDFIINKKITYIDDANKLVLIHDYYPNLELEKVNYLDKYKDYKLYLFSTYDLLRTYLICQKYDLEYFKILSYIYDVKQLFNKTISLKIEDNILKLGNETLDLILYKKLTKEAKNYKQLDTIMQDLDSFTCFYGNTKGNEDIYLAYGYDLQDDYHFAVINDYLKNKISGCDVIRVSNESSLELFSLTVTDVIKINEQDLSRNINDLPNGLYLIEDIIENTLEESDYPSSDDEFLPTNLEDLVSYTKTNAIYGQKHPIEQEVNDDYSLVYTKDSMNDNAIKTDLDKIMKFMINNLNDYNLSFYDGINLTTYTLYEIFNEYVNTLYKDEFVLYSLPKYLDLKDLEYIDYKKEEFIQYIKDSIDKKLEKINYKYNTLIYQLLIRSILNN